MGTWLVDVDASTPVGNVSADSASSERAAMQSYRSLNGTSRELLVGIQQGSSSWLEQFFGNLRPSGGDGLPAPKLSARFEHIAEGEMFADPAGIRCILILYPSREP